MGPRLSEEDVIAMVSEENFHTKAHSDVSVVLLAHEVLYHRAKEGTARLVRLEEQPMAPLKVIPWKEGDG